jgi:hypothetical protein
MDRLIASSRALHLLDGAVVLWVALWIGLGVAVGINVHALTSLSHTTSTVGHAVEGVGRSLRLLGGLPLIGAAVVRDALQIQHAGASAALSGKESGSSIDALSLLLAIVVALLPSVPLLAFYLSLRLDRRHEAQVLRLAVGEQGSDPAFQAFLARRALASVGYRRLRMISAAPWAEIEQGACAALAEAELERHGIAASLLQNADADGS